MRKNAQSLTLTTCSAALCAIAGVATCRAADEVELKEAQVPAAVMATFKTAAKDGTLISVNPEDDGDDKGKDKDKEKEKDK
jgi:hypothetical protein